MQITQVRAVALEHRRFILDYGDQHITTASFDYFAANTPTDVLLEARGEDGELIGVSFASADGECSITVVHRGHRGQGIGTALMLAKRDLVRRLKSHVAVTNTASMRLSAKVYGNRGQVQKDGRVLFQSEEQTQ